VKEDRKTRVPISRSRIRSCSRARPAAVSARRVPNGPVTWAARPARVVVREAVLAVNRPPSPDRADLVNASHECHVFHIVARRRVARAQKRAREPQRRYGEFANLATVKKTTAAAVGPMKRTSSSSSSTSPVAGKKALRYGNRPMGGAARLNIKGAIKFRCSRRGSSNGTPFSMPFAH